MARIVVDPVTRVGGHLRVEADLADGAIRDALVSATSYRGIETILRGRDAREAWLLASRVCGIASGVHALAAVRAVENALGIAVPRNARLIRNVLAGTQAVRDHAMAIYARQLPDWVDVGSALRADPAATSTLARGTGDGARSDAGHFAAVRARLDAAVRSGRPGLLANGPTGHPAIALSPEQNLLLLAHHLDALDWQREIARVQVLLGGKDPHPQSFLVGGMTLTPPWGGPRRATPGQHPQQVERRSPSALGDHGLDEIARHLADARRFVDAVLLPDVSLLAAAYSDWATIGDAGGAYLAAGEFPDDDSRHPDRLLPAGRIAPGDIAGVAPVDHGSIGESSARAWYDDDASPGLRHPWDGRTEPHRPAPAAGPASLDPSVSYSWLKTARYEGEPMEVGPVARVLVARATGAAAVRTALEEALSGLHLGPEALRGTLGRIVARAIEAKLLADRLGGWLEELAENLSSGDLAVADITSWDPGAWPRDAQGWSLGEAPEGTVGHWVRIEGGRVRAWQIVGPAGWNASPRDAAGRPSPLEAALVGTPIADRSHPIEALRVVHSFDPCAACGVH